MLQMNTDLQCKTTNALEKMAAGVILQVKS
jgi:hypothetical protein